MVIVLRQKVDTTDLVAAFRKNRGQVLTSVNNSREVKSKKPVSKSEQNKNGQYQKWLSKYNDLENNVDSFKSMDILYYFREKSQESGHPYVVANLNKDLGIFKRILERYEPREVCLMIEFLFFSEQDYLDKAYLSPGLLSSSWCNTIHSDALLWADDKYIPRSHKKKVERPTREWKKNDDSDKSKIGEW